jgi:hypothetical protein
MRTLEFQLDDTEWGYRGTAHYSVRKGDKGDHDTPAVGDAVDQVWVMRLDAYGVVGGERIEWHDTDEPPECEGHWKRKLMRSRLLMERLEELCEADLASGRAVNTEAKHE